MKRTLDVYSSPEVGDILYHDLPKNRWCEGKSESQYFCKAISPVKGRAKELFNPIRVLSFEPSHMSFADGYTVSLEFCTLIHKHYCPNIGNLSLDNVCECVVVAMVAERLRGDVSK